MGAEMERVETCVRYIREKTGFEPHTALVLGSGLGGFADNVKIEAVVEYGEIEGFRVHRQRSQGAFCPGLCGKKSRLPLCREESTTMKAIPCGTWCCPSG